MSKKQEIESVEAGNESHRSASVFDFLYHDSRRIASFLAQLDELGHLQQITQTDQVEDGQSEDSRTTGSLGVPGAIGGKIDSGSGASSSRVEASQRVYDPFWANARRFLDLLTEREMISRDIAAARIGQFVLAQGSLITADLSVYKDLWRSDIIRRFIISRAAASDDEQPGNRQQRRSGQTKGNKQAPPTEADLTMEILPYMPHSSQINILNEDYAVWGTLDSNNMSGTFPDLMLKHGAKIAGTWSALGILDALPFEAGDLPTALELIRVGGASNSVTNLPLTMAPHIRLLMGRPLQSYGITPLLVFREAA